MVPVSCLRTCHQTCERQVLADGECPYPAPDQCVSGCMCPAITPINHEGTCIPRELCPTPRKNYVCIKIIFFGWLIVSYSTPGWRYPQRSALYNNIAVNKIQKKKNILKELLYRTRRNAKLPKAATAGRNLC